MRHKLGIVITAVAALGLTSASFAILGRQPDVSTALGRHLYAGALANASLALTMFLIAVIPLRKRQRWAFWALCAPVPLYGIPMLVLDATHVAPERLFVTLAPQVGGLGLLLTGLVLVLPSLFGQKESTPRP